MKFTLLLMATFIYSNEAGKLMDKVREFGEKEWEKYNKKVENTFNPLTLVYRNSCISDLGCFYTGPPFYHPVHRPISVLPSEEVDKITFLLYTKDDASVEHELQPNPKSIKGSNFNPSLKTVILVHGWMAYIDTIDIREKFKSALFENGDYNLIICDWTELNKHPYYKAAANARIVGAKLAKLIKRLKKIKEVKAESFHIIGHSFGAHIAGYIGQRVKKLGRITALDPAGSYFRYTDPEVRLDPTDAIFVDVIHTNGAELFTGGLGMHPPVGHMDFYPNGGKHQPGCVFTSNWKNSIGKAINDSYQLLNMACDHGRASVYFLESMAKSKCKFLAVQCANYTSYEKGLCQPKKSQVAEMGFHSKMIPELEFPAQFYMRTNKEEPFCNQKSIKIKGRGKIQRIGGAVLKGVGQLNPLGRRSPLRKLNPLRKDSPIRKLNPLRKGSLLRELNPLG